jgi:hypothetical protein
MRKNVTAPEDSGRGQWFQLTMTEICFSMENIRLKRAAVGPAHAGGVIFNFRDRDLTTSATTDYIRF